MKLFGLIKDVHYQEKTTNPCYTVNIFKTYKTKGSTYLPIFPSSPLITVLLSAFNVLLSWLMNSRLSCNLKGRRKIYKFQIHYMLLMALIRISQWNISFLNFSISTRKKLIILIILRAKSSLLPDFVNKNFNGTQPHAFIYALHMALLMLQL